MTETKKWWAFWHRYVINRDGPYITRLRIVQTPWFGVYLHRIHKPDQAVMHDHPWSFVSLVLRGCYWERVAHSQEATVYAQQLARTNCSRLGRLHKRGWLSLHRMTTDQFHTITHLGRWPTTTLVFVGRRRREWGFATQHGWTEHNKYEAQLQYMEAQLNLVESQRNFVDAAQHLKDATGQ